RPVESDTRGTLLQLFGAHQCRQRPRHAVERAGGSFAGALGRLDGFPACVAAFSGWWCASEDMRMARLELVRNRPGDVVEVEQAGFFGNARLEDHLEQQVAKLVADLVDVASGN